MSAGTDAPLAVVLVGDLAAPADPALDRLIGAGSAQRLRRALVARARRWAAATAAGHAWEATSLDAARAALHAHGHAGPVLLVAPDVPGLDADLAAAARDDLAHGVTLTLGASHDGTPYIVGIAAVDDELIELAARGFEELVHAVTARGGTLGMLRSERRLSSAADAAALAIDPLTPADLSADLVALARRLRAAVQQG